MSAQPTNRGRAEWAEAYILHYQCRTGTDWEDAPADLLCDLMHFCDRESFDFERELDRARTHYEAERADAIERKTVVIEVLRGVAHVSQCPADVIVNIIDHDEQGRAP